MISDFQRIGTMIDCSRNAVMNLKTIKKWIDITSSVGYNTLLLYMEDVYTIDNHAYFGYMRGRYSFEELKEIDDYAFSKQMEVIPCIQTLGHLETFLRLPDSQDVRDCQGVLLTKEEKTYQLIDDAFLFLSKTFRSKVINIGMDEAYYMTCGKFREKHAESNREEVFFEHLDRVSQLGKKYDLQLIMWGDMFLWLRNQWNISSNDSSFKYVKKYEVPDNTGLIYWDYYHPDTEFLGNIIDTYKKIKKENFWFAGGFWSWVGFTPRNKFSMEHTKCAVDACKKKGVKNIFFTLWGDDGSECSKFSLLPSMFYAIESIKGITDENVIRKEFKNIFNIDFDDFMLLDLPDTSTQSKEIVNPEKYSLYDDTLLNLFSNTLSIDDALRYERAAKCLEKLIFENEYGYIFNTQYLLCEVLRRKIRLDKTVYEFYRSGDKESLKDTLFLFEETVKSIRKFYAAFDYQWHKENKAFGFEVQDQRIGGLIFRLEACAKRIKKYITGEIERIEELEEVRLQYYPENKSGNPIFLNSWINNISAGTV